MPPQSNDENLEALVAGLRSSGLDFSGPPLEVRAQFEAMLGTIPVDPLLQFTETELGGVPCLRCTGSTDASTARNMLYLHGGAYVVGSANGYRRLAGELARATNATNYALDYRLAPEHVFPAAVDDVVAAYVALLESGVAATNIAIAGDSAGGGLAVASLLAFRERGLPQPAGALAISPWVDLRCCSNSLRTKADEDPSLSAAGLQSMASRYLGASSPTNPLASPALADLAGLAPLMIQVGSSEILFDDALLLAQNAGAAGVAVRLDVWPNMPHVWHAFSFMLPAGQQAIKEAGAFLSSRLESAIQGTAR